MKLRIRAKVAPFIVMVLASASIISATEVQAAQNKALQGEGHHARHHRCECRPTRHHRAAGHHRHHINLIDHKRLL